MDLKEYETVKRGSFPKMAKKGSFLKPVFFILVSGLIFVFGFGAGYFYSQRTVSLNNGRIEILGKTPSVPQGVDFSLFWEAWEVLFEKYINSGEIDPQELLYGAVAGMVKSVGDPYTAFFKPEEFTELKKQMAGKYEGVGIEMGFKDGQIVIVSPFEDSPAFKKGVKAGDIILAIDDERTTDMSLSEAATRIRGDKGTKVELTLLHEGESTPYSVEITRTEITYKSVKVEFIDNIAHIRLVHFLETTNQDWDELVKEIVEKNPEGVVLDLRNNPGGYVSSAVYVAGDFVQNQVVTKEKFGDGEEKILRSNGLGRLSKYPMVILVNEGTASASEILAGALRHYDKAKLLGKKTFGKGIVQEEVSLSQGTAMHVTNAEWLLPSGENIHEDGLDPDEEIDLTTEDFKAGKDPQLDRALEILKGE